MYLDTLTQIPCSYCHGTGLHDEENNLSKTKLLLVEGNDDYRFFQAILNRKRIENIQIMNYGGKDSLKKTLESLPKRPGFTKLKAIGITRDADDKTGQERFKQVSEYIKHEKIKNIFSVPKELGKFYCDISKLKTGVFIFPSRHTSGELEDLCIKSIEDSSLKCVNQFMECVGTVKKPSKTKLYTWLAMQEKPNLRLGEAADKGFFDFENPVFEPLIDFIDELSVE